MHQPLHEGGEHHFACCFWHGRGTSVASIMLYLHWLSWWKDSDEPGWNPGWSWTIHNNNHVSSRLSITRKLFDFSLQRDEILQVLFFNSEQTDSGRLSFNFCLGLSKPQSIHETQHCWISTLDFSVTQYRNTCSEYIFRLLSSTLVEKLLP